MAASYSPLATAPITPLTPIEREQVRALVDAHGDYGTAAALGISRQTVARAVAGLRLQHGTVTLVRAYLTEAR